MASGLDVADPLAHRALQALMRAESAVKRTLAVELERAGVSPAGFSALVVLTTAGGSLELRTLRRRLGWSKANATEVTLTLETRGLVRRRRLPHDPRPGPGGAPPARARPPRGGGGPDARGAITGGAPVPRPCQPRQHGVLGARRVREAQSGGHLPQARRVGALVLPSWIPVAPRQGGRTSPRSGPWGYRRRRSTSTGPRAGG